MRIYIRSTNAINTRNILLKCITHCYTFCEFVTDALQKHKIFKNDFSLELRRLPTTHPTKLN